MKYFLVRAAGYSFIAFLLIAAIILVFEIFLRSRPGYDREWMDYDSVTVWRVIKNNVSKKWTYDYPEFMQSTNREGFNDLNHDYDKKPGVKRVMIIGDSYTAGLDYPKDKIFTSIIEQKLNEKFPGKYEVMNCATPAWSTEQEFMYFIAEGKRYNPDYVLLMVAPNDIRESYTRRMLPIRGDTVDPWIVNAMTKSEKLNWKLCAHSSLAVWARKKEILVGATFDDMLWKYFSQSFPGLPADSAWDQPLFLKQWPWQLREAENRFKTLLSAFNNHCRQSNATLLVSVIPTKQEFDSTFSDTATYESGRVAHWMDTICANKNIPFLQTYDQMKKVDDKMKLYQYWEFHLNIDGHRFMGDELAALIERHTSVVRTETKKAP